jgi:phosphatidate cytidylyltransferase
MDGWWFWVATKGVRTMLTAQLQFADYLGLRAPVVWAQAGIILSLLVGSVARWLSTRSAAPEIVRKRLASLGTWWVIAILLVLSLAFGRVGGVVFFCLVSLLALKEYLSLTGVNYRDWRVVGWAYLAVPLHYLWLYLGWHNVFLTFIPLCALLFLATRMVVRGQSEKFTLVAASLHWGLMLTVYCLSFGAALLTLPGTTNAVAGAAGWFLYLVLLTALSDIVQALVGRKFGRRKVAPVLSPHKTWAGLVGGIIVTTAMAVVLAPFLTPFADDVALEAVVPVLAIPYLPAVLAGLIISVSGFFGDLTISGIKRDVGVKDSGKMLPGQGGILDRVDSLIFAAPLFYYFVTCLFVV